MNFPQAITKCFKNYDNFSGRAVRSEYWYFLLFFDLVQFITRILDNAFFAMLQPLHPLTTVFVLAVMIPTLAVAVRRLHDVNRSGWWLLINFTIIGIIYPLLVWKCTKGTEGENRFGADPLVAQA